MKYLFFSLFLCYNLVVYIYCVSKNAYNIKKKRRGECNFPINNQRCNNNMNSLIMNKYLYKKRKHSNTLPFIKTYKNFKEKNKNDVVYITYYSINHNKKYNNKINTHILFMNNNNNNNNNNSSSSSSSSSNNKEYIKANNTNMLFSIYNKISEDGKSKNSLLSDISKLFKIVKDSKLIFVTGFLLTTLSAIVDSYIPIFLSKTISFVMERKNFTFLKIHKTNLSVVKDLIEYLKFFSTNPFHMYVLISVISLLFSSFRSYIFNVCAYVSTNKLQKYLFNVLLHKNMNYFKKKGKGELISRLNIDSSELIDIFTTNIIVLFRNMIKIVLSFYFLYKINVHLFIVSLFIVFIISNISIFFSNIFRKLAKEESNVVAQSNNIVEESIYNFSLISTFNTHNKEIKKYNNSLDTIYMSRMKLGLLYIIEKFFIRLIDMMTFILTLILSKKTLMYNLNTDTRTIISSVIYMQNIIAQSCTIEQQYSRVQELIGNAEDVIKLIEKDNMRNNNNNNNENIKLVCNKYNFFSILFNINDMKNFIFNHSLLKKFQTIQNNSDYVSNIIKPNYLKLFERNYNNLIKLFFNEKNYNQCDESLFKNGSIDDIINNIDMYEKKEETHKTNKINDYHNFISNKQVYDNKTKDCTLKKKKQDNSFHYNTPNNNVDMKNQLDQHCFSKSEKFQNKLKKKIQEINMQEVYQFIKNDHELIIKYKLDRKFIRFLKTHYKKNIILFILKLYKERNNSVSDNFLFLFDNISSFKNLSMKDKKSILKMSNITNKTIYIILLTFLFYNYSKFYYKRQKKKNFINFIEKKNKMLKNNQNVERDQHGSSTYEKLYESMDDEININDVLSDTMCDNSNGTICDNSNDTICDNSNDTICDNSNDTMCDNSNDTICNNSNDTICGNSNDTLCDNSNDISRNYQSNQHLYPQIMSTKPNKNDQYNNNPTDNLELNNELVILNKTKSRTKKKRNLNNILPYIVENAIKELEILKFIDANYKSINENLILDNIKDNQKGSTLIFENVDFYFAKYPKNKILSNINLKFSNKYTYGILCYNDSGKNYLAKLAARLYNKTYGNILLDDENIENISKYILTKKISLVEEQSYIFSDSIIYNMLYSYNCITKGNKNFYYLNYNFKLNQNNINNCVHLFSHDNDITTSDYNNNNINKNINSDNYSSSSSSSNTISSGRNNEQYEKIKEKNKKKKIKYKIKENKPSIYNIHNITNNNLVDQSLYTFKNFKKKCLMCGSFIDTKLLEEQKKSPGYNKYKVHFIKKLYKEIIKVSKIVCLYDVINSYPDKFFHNINDKILSGGQKQKISLARAIIKKPKILILDDAFSALDAANELKIFSSLKNYLPNCTIVNLSHKITTVNKCDYIYVLKDGKIIEHGLRTKLIQNRNSEYIKKFNEY
ncbi:ABC transporter, (TAP family), putative [Plasmodium reichenowi]|uniref:ABC transporter, (TAP family), putative n=1 Tax=Plasmodium reichenowi TaxID=5854 RepID=A0A060RSL7_PLARE|nr:ABC transporter, (TAP family), putative [Plasmodium reichenowi]